MNLNLVVKNLPNLNGVYRFYSKDGSLLYIGKAKNLKKRVSSYFQEGRVKNQRLTLMVSQIHKIEFTITKTEKEALLLEADLIHNLQPKYNILLKEQKNYFYVQITNDVIPAVFLVKEKLDKESLYFGPFNRKQELQEMLRTLRIIFPFCQQRNFLQKDQKENSLYYSISQKIRSLKS